MLGFAVLSTNLHKCKLKQVNSASSQVPFGSKSNYLAFNQGQSTSAQITAASIIASNTAAEPTSLACPDSL